MRQRERTKRTLWYANYVGEEDITDDYDNIIGCRVIYSNPVSARWSVNAVDSDAELRMFGINAVETIKVYPNKQEFDLDESSIIWWGITPVINQDGSTDTPHNFVMAGIKESPNVVCFYAKKVNVGTAT